MLCNGFKIKLRIIFIDKFVCIRSRLKQLFVWEMLTQHDQFILEKIRIKKSQIKSLKNDLRR